MLSYIHPNNTYKLLYCSLQCVFIGYKKSQKGYLPKSHIQQSLYHLACHFYEIIFLFQSHSLPLSILSSQHSFKSILTIVILSVSYPIIITQLKVVPSPHMITSSSPTIHPLELPYTLAHSTSSIYMSYTFYYSSSFS